MAALPGGPFEIPGPVKALAERIGARGGRLYIVGGWVRDLLRGEESADIDLATDLPPGQVKQALEGFGPVYTIGEKFGTVGTAADGYSFEITTLRTDTYAPGSRHPEVTRVEDLHEDLSRRDFTINAMAIGAFPPGGELIDLFGGARDLEAGVLKSPGSPAPRMKEDPLRMMRAVRFAAQFGFRIDPGLYEVLRSMAPEMGNISWERKRDELEKILVSANPDLGVGLLAGTGLLAEVSPELYAMKGVAQPEAYHRADVLEHTLLTMACLEPDPLLRRAALFHDVGKPPTRVIEPRLMFPGHDRAGAELTRRAMKRLKYPGEKIEATAFLVRRHMRPIRYEPSWSDAAVRRLVRDCALLKNGETVVPLSAVFELARADVRAGSLERAPRFLEAIDALEARIRRLGATHEEIHRATSPLNGDELMELFGRGPGRWLGPVKHHLEQLVVDGLLRPGDREAAAAAAREYLERERPGG